MCLSAQLGSHASSAEGFCGAGEGRGEATGGKTGRLKSTITRSLSFTTSPCATAPHGGPNKTTISRGGVCVGGGGGGGTTQCARFVFATPARSLRRQVRSGGKIKNETGLSVSPNRFYIIHSRGSRKTKIIMRADGNNENLRVEKHGIIVCVTAEEHVLMALIYE